MKTEPKPKSNPGKVKGSEDVGVKDYITEIKEQRKRRTVDEDFMEDEILEIVNHKRRWKRTYSQRVQRLMKVKIMKDGNLRMN